MCQVDVGSCQSWYKPSLFTIDKVSNKIFDLGKTKALADQLSVSSKSLDRMVNMQVRGDMIHWTWYGTPADLFPEVLQTAKPLHIAAYMGHADIIRMLLAYGASVDGEDESLRTPLHHAAAEGRTSLIQLLLDAGANANALDSNLFSPCMVAAEGGHVDVIRSLLTGGADVQLRSDMGETALQIAAYSGAKDVFVLLMTRSDLYTEDVHGRSVLYEAVRESSSFRMIFLTNLAPPSQVYESQRRSILNTAIANRSSAEVKLLLRRVPTHILPRLLDHRDVHGTPLHLAAILSKVDTMNLLLDKGSQTELEGSEHGTPLMAACATGRLVAVKILVARGARTSYVKDGQVYSALTAAKYHPQVRRWLLVGRFLEGPKLLTCKETG